MSVTMSRLILVKGVGPVLQIAEGALPCQAAEPLSAEPVSIEIGIGNGHLQMQMPAIDVDVQRNLFGPVAVMSLSQIDVSAWDRDPTRNYLVVNHLNLLQMAGIGAAVRVGWFAPGIFFLAGGRYYHSRAEVRGIIEPVLVTDRFCPRRECSATSTWEGGISTSMPSFTIP
jgi:hypothetical protein